VWCIVRHSDVMYICGVHVQEVSGVVYVFMCMCACVCMYVCMYVRVCVCVREHFVCH